jgi:hypothetical protein
MSEILQETSMSKSASSVSDLNLDASLVAASADAALDAVAKAGGAAEALIGAWIKAGNAAAVNEVAERGTGAPRKAARRGLNVLKARGIAIPARSRVVHVAGAPESESYEAYMLAPDSVGTTLLVLAARTKTSRLRSAFVFLNDAVGVQRVDIMELSQSQLRDSLNNALRGGEYKPVKVPVEWARKRVADARQRQKERGLLEPLGLDSAKNLLEPVPAEAVDHPFDGEGLELSHEDAKELAKKSALLHAVPEFRGWIAPGPAVDELLARVGETLEPGQEPPADVLSARIEEEVKSACDRYFTPERRAELVKLMKDSALSVLNREGETRALEVVAAMKVIEAAGLVTDPPHEVPFLRGFFDKAIGILLAQGQGRLRIPVRRRPEEAAGAPEASAKAPAEAAAPAPEEKPAEG